MKKIFKHFLFLILCFVLFFNTSTVLADDLIEESESTLVSTNVSDSRDFEIFSKCALVYERNSKSILYEKNIYEKVPMASTTKIMTCILILENCNLDDVVSVSKSAASTIGSRLGLSANDKISVQDLLYGLMLCSGNDAAACLAEVCSSSIESFALLMNQKASEIGLSSTHFVTPHGLDDDHHYTTAYDFAILTDYALNNPHFKQIVGTKYYTVYINNSPKQIHNTNELLGSVSGVYGVKTGYTSKAGRCLISAACKNNLDIIVIVFGADTKKIRNIDSSTLINYIFSHYETINLRSLIDEKYEEYLSYYLPYTNVNKSFYSLNTYLQDFDITYFPVKKSENNIYFASLLTYDLEAPISKGQTVACINVFVNNSQIISINICSTEYINRKSPIDYVLYFAKQYKTFYTV